LEGQYKDFPTCGSKKIIATSAPSQLQICTVIHHPSLGATQILPHCGLLFIRNCPNLSPPTCHCSSKHLETELPLCFLLLSSTWPTWPDGTTMLSVLPFLTFNSNTSLTTFMYSAWMLPRGTQNLVIFWSETIETYNSMIHKVMVHVQGWMEQDRVRFYVAT
jgi:hypothetical protein